MPAVRSEIFQKGMHAGRQMRFGVREHAMSSVLNGMFAYGGMRPFGATFLNFITYAWGGVRLRFVHPGRGGESEVGADESGYPSNMRSLLVSTLCELLLGWPGRPANFRFFFFF